jgi:hypothetical protein
MIGVTKVTVGTGLTTNIRTTKLTLLTLTLWTYKPGSEVDVNV